MGEGGHNLVEAHDITGAFIWDTLFFTPHFLDYPLGKEVLSVVVLIEEKEMYCQAKAFWPLTLRFRARKQHPGSLDLGQRICTLDKERFKQNLARGENLMRLGDLLRFIP